MKLRIFSLMLIVLLSACGAATLPTGAEEPVADAEGWVMVSPGFRYRDTYGGIDFWVTTSELTVAGLESVETHVRALESAAESEMERFRLAEWQKTLADAQDNYAAWQAHWPEIQAQLEEASREAARLGLLPQGTALELAAPSCSLGATAAPTTASPGAKAYATANCNPGSVISGYVRAETTAHAGSQWPPACSAEAWATTQCSSVAYGSYNCASSAYAAYYYKVTNVTFVQDSRSSSNGRCT